MIFGMIIGPALVFTALGAVGARLVSNDFGWGLFFGLWIFWGVEITLAPYAVKRLEARIKEDL